MSDMGDMWKDFKAERKKLRAKYGEPCPECIKKLPKANPSILLPGQRCNLHSYYRDPRNRDIMEKDITWKEVK